MEIKIPRGKNSKIRAKRTMAVALVAAMTVGNLYNMPTVSYAAEDSVDVYSTLTEDRTIAEYGFGTDITTSSIYNAETAYGFSDVTFPNAAEGWVSGVYKERQPVYDNTKASYIAQSDSGLAISSKVWTETESTGYGVYTYENTSSFDMDLENADYEVTVEFTNPTSTAYTAYLEAEDITKASGIKVAAGATVTQTFTACLVDGQLNVRFLAESTATTEESAVVQTVYVDKFTVVEKATNAKEDVPTVFIASDSTVQTYDSSYYPQTGWGQVLYSFFEGADNMVESEAENCNYSQAQTYTTDSVVIENRAIGGRSSKSFILEGKLDDLLEDVKPGDYVLVQWGHNDATTSRPNRYVSSADFEQYLQYYVEGVEQRGGTCILVTPVARRSFTTSLDGDVSFKSDFESYRQVMLSMGEEYDIPVLDLTTASIEVCNKFGDEGSKSLFLWLNAGDYEGYYAGGVSDSTHLQYYGAYKFAQCVANLIRSYDKDDRLDSLKAIVPEIQIPDSVPSVPANLSTTTVGASSVSLTWDAVGDAELYYIYRAELEDGQTVEDIDFTDAEKYSVVSIPKYTDSNCVGGKTYVYAVAGFNEAGVGDTSELLSVTTKSALYKYDFCQNASDATMEGWNQVTCTQLYTQEAGYGWLTAPGNGRNRSGNTNADSNAMTDDFCLGDGEFAVDLPNGDYEITVTACDLLSGTSTIKPSYTAEGVSIGTISTKQAAGTVSANVRVVDGQLNIVVGGTNKYINGLEITPLTLAPTGLIYQEMTFDDEKANFLLQWNDVENAVSYNVYRKSSSDTVFSIDKNITQEVKDTSTTLPFTAALGEVYEYYVTAVLQDGTETAMSNTITIEMIDTSMELPKAPTNLTCTNAETANMVLTWDSIDGAIKYIIYRSDREEGTKGYKEYTKIGESTTNSFNDTDSDVTANINWFYKVQAVNAGGAGDISESVKTDITTTLTRQEAETLTDRALVAINLAGDDGTGVDENGNEGINVSSADSGVYLSWRVFEADSDDVTFTLYKNGEELVKNLTVSNYIDEDGTADDNYKVVGSTDEALSLSSDSVATWQNKYIELTLDTPQDQTMPDDTICSYTANDMSVGDLDGDGDYELIVKWYPSNAKDNSGAGYTGTTILDAYDINANTGEAVKLWRIDLGINIRSGAHYTQFQVWDFDGDGKAEIMCKTADGTVDGEGTVIGDALADYRNSSGYVLDGPEYLTAFDGETGAIIDTTDYTPARGNVSAWGDGYGNRVDRFLSCVAYLDGVTPSAVFCRGYYTRTCLTAYKLVEGKLVEQWAYDTDLAGSEYEAQGDHGLSVNDIDNDGKDEIIYGSLVIDHTGETKYSTGLGHGDAMHVSDWVSSNEGLEIFQVHEHTDATYQVEIHDAETGEILYGYFTGKDTGRGVAADIDPTNEGAEFWSSTEWNGTDGGLYSASSTFDNVVQLSQNTPSVNFSIFWDGDLLSELQDHTFNNSGSNYYPVSTNITKWNYETNESDTLFESAEILTNNGTKGNLGLVADIMGDWREEIISRTNDSSNSTIRIYSTTIETEYSVPCLMENDAYRIGVAWENVGYNQPANLSYLLSEGLVTADVSVSDTSYNSVDLQWTEANDGTYGHDIEGYEVYRYNEDTEDYDLIATLDADDYVTINPNSGEEVITTTPYEAYYDFGGVDGVHGSVGACQNGFTEITSSTPAYSSEQGYGLTAESLAGITFRNYNKFTDELADMYNDCAMGWNSNVEFLADVPNGDYEVTVYTAHLAGTAKNLIYVEDMENNVARYANNSTKNVTTVNVTVTDGQIDIMSKLDPSYSGAVYLNGVAIRQIVEETADEDSTQSTPINVYRYVDTNLEQNTEYTYKVAAIVDGKTSFMSDTTTGKTLLSIASISELEAMTIVQDTADYQSLLPTTVEVIDRNGNVVDGIAVTWNLDNFDISTPGVYELVGSVAGYDGTVTLVVTVKENVVLDYDALEDVYMVSGSKLVLPKTINHNMSNGSTITTSVEWDTSAVDTNSVGKYTAIGSTELLDTIIINVIVKENYIVSVESLTTIEAYVGETPVFPATVTATYADGTVKEVPVTFDTIDTSEAVLLTAIGHVEDYSSVVTVGVNVIVEPYIRFDFGISTSKVAEGWTGVTVNGKGGTSATGYEYTQERGYGFTDSGSDSLSSAIEGRTESYTYEGVLPSLVYTDFVLPAGKEFKVDVPNGTYTVSVVAGSYYSSNVKVSIEGADNVTISNAAGTYNIYTVSGVEITDSQMNFVFPSGTFRMNAISITREEDYQDEGSTPGVDSTPDEGETPEESETPDEGDTPEEEQASYDVTFNKTTCWGHGFVGNITVTNNTDAVLTDWQLEFDYADDIISIWGAEIVSHEGNHYVIRPVSYNEDVAAHSSMQFGFVGNSDTVFSNNEPVNKLVLIASEEVTQEYTLEVKSHFSAGKTSLTNIVLTNDSEENFTDWKIEFDYDDEITLMWGAKVLTHTGNHYVISCPSYYKTIKSGDSAYIGFMASSVDADVDAQISNVTVTYMK